MTKNAVYYESGKNNEQPELSNLKVLYYLYAFLIISLIIMPQYFGVHIGYDITCTRLADMLLVAYMIMNRKVFMHFWTTVTRCEVLYPLAAYLFVAAYTMVFRTDINAFFLVFFEILNFFLLIYGIRFVIGYRKALKWTVGCAYFLCIYGLVEYLYGESIFHKFLSTLPNAVTSGYRSGHYRIMGPCGHSLGYGLLLILLLAVVCYDLERNKINILKRPLLVLLILVNIFLTGSRSTLGIVVVELCIIFLMQKSEERKKSFVAIVGALIVLSVFLMVFQDTDIGQYILGQIASVVDEVFGTNYAEQFGVDVTTLENSTEYRKMLPYILTLDWLNPLVGRGRGFGGAEINGVYIQSIDHYYIAQYIKYAYPGLITYCLFMLVGLCVMLKESFGNKSALSKTLMIGAVMYFVSLWWVDALQTLKFLYLILAIFYANRLERIDEKKYGKTESQCCSTGV